MKKTIMALFTLLPALAVAQTLHSDIPYHTEPGVNPNLLSLDVHQPDNSSGLLPVMVYIHGGYWNAGDKANVGQRAKLFTDSGYVFVSINYRLSPDPVDTLSADAVRFPTHPEDCARAVRWVYEHIGDYQGDSSRISLIGHSAGAHLALLLSTNELFLENEGLTLQHIKCTCSLDAGVFDVAEELQQAGSYIPRRAPLINAFGTDPALYDDASPQLHLEAGKYLPWLHLVHQNTNDRLYSHDRFKDSILANGHTHVSLFNAAPYNHGQINANLGSPLDSIGETQAVMQFFNNCLNAPTTGVHDGLFPATNVKLFPNPVKDLGTVTGLPNYFVGTVSISNILGQVFLVERKNGSTFNFQADNLNNGVYVILIRADSGQTICKKFIKQ